METPIKHRITGAIILVALIVILVPEMLSGPPAPDAEAPSNSITLPTSGTASTAPLRSIDIDVGEREPGRESPPAATSSTQATAEDTPQDTASAATAVPSSSATAVATGAYVVQVGSFAARTTADALAATLRRQGFAATVSVVEAGGRTLHRVRVGPAGARAAADELRTRLRAAGHSGSVVAGP